MEHRRTAHWTVLLLAALVAGAASLQARLGEDEAACDIRYNPSGKNVEHWIKGGLGAAHFLPGPGTVVRSFSYEGWVVTVGFREGRAARMRFQHEEPTSRFQPEFAAKITDDETAAILSANSYAGAWREVPAEQFKSPSGRTKVVRDTTGCGRLWIRADGAIAYMLPRPNATYPALYLEDRTYVQEHYRPPAPEKDPPAPRPIPKF